MGRPAFQKFISFAVLLPESFRGGCSFGVRLATALSREGSSDGRFDASPDGPKRYAHHRERVSGVNAGWISVVGRFEVQGQFEEM
jgi:hypothetical protein